MNSGFQWQSEFGFLVAAVLVPGALLASWSDYRAHRVPNWLNAGLAAAGLTAQSYCFGWAGLKMGVLGMLVGFSLLFLLWLVKGMGAGDVKFMTAIGAWLGPVMTFYAALAGGLVGGLVAVGIIVCQRSWRQTATNLGLLLTKVSSPRTAFGEFASAKALGQSGVMMPYAIPLSLGTLLVLVSSYYGWWEVP